MTSLCPLRRRVRFLNMNLLLHICCGNCAIVPVRTLREEGNHLTGFWFNPNIHPYEEYESRLTSLKDLSGRWRIEMLYSPGYDPAEYFNWVAPARSIDDHLPGAADACERCKTCYSLRLERTAQEAVKNGFDAFTTTLLISPYQDFEQISAVGRHLSDKYNILFFLRDFRPSFRKAMSEARALGLYRQTYCGCVFSRNERGQRREREKAR